MAAGKKSKAVPRKGVDAGQGGPAGPWQGEWARPGGRGFDALRCLSILIVRHIWDSVAVPMDRRMGRAAAGEGERLEWVAAAICATESLMQRDLPLTLKALARHFEGLEAGGGPRGHAGPGQAAASDGSRAQKDIM